MIKNIYLILLLVFMSVTFFNCSEDQDFRRRMNPQERAAELKDHLDLTDEQAKQIETILIESQNKMSEMRKNFEGDREQMRNAMMNSREEVEKKIEEILYEDQKIKYQEYRDEQQQRMRNFRRERRE